MRLYSICVIVIALMFTGNLIAQDIEAKLSGTTDAQGFTVKDNANNTLFTIRGNGKAGLGTVSPAFRLSLEKDGGILARGTEGSGATLPSTSGPVMIWYPRKAAFRAGSAESGSWDDAKVGYYSFASGNGTTASGDYSTAMGRGTTASGDYATALSFYTTASGFISTAMGRGTTASGDYATALSLYTTASGYASTAMGRLTTASGDYATAMGYRTIASGEYSTAMGSSTASARYSTAMGYNTTASGNYSTVLGKDTKASGSSSAALGYLCTASGDASIAMGCISTASGKYSTATGYTTTASGDYATAMGYRSFASGIQSVSIGSWVTTNSHKGSIILGDASTSTYRRSNRDNRLYAYFDNGYTLYTNGSGSYCVYLGHNDNSWRSCSDSTKKVNYRAADGEEVLRKFSAFRLGSWNYKGQDASRYRHYGAMAQEWFTAFGHDGVGLIGNDTSLSSADVDGIAYIAIQALERRTAELQKATSRIVTLEKTVMPLRESNKSIQKELTALRAKVSEMDELKAELAEVRSLLRKFTEYRAGVDDPYKAEAHIINRVSTKTTRPTGMAD